MTQIYGNWILEMQKIVEIRERNIKFLEESHPFDDQRLRSLDATLKKVTAFTKKLKNVSSTTISQLLPDLEKLNLRYCVVPPPPPLHESSRPFTYFLSPPLINMGPNVML
ncbi:unnamed protein product [Meloidogyne enterolobii]|uniref:Uncharacterized protein n=1 Tax=Meloidogyne enterolobii TaxID=390850 RepID=A0ACB1AZP5_MELEN